MISRSPQSVLDVKRSGMGHGYLLDTAVVQSRHLVVLKVTAGQSVLTFIVTALLQSIFKVKYLTGQFWKRGYMGTYQNALDIFQVTLLVCARHQLLIFPRAFVPYLIKGTFPFHYLNLKVKFRSSFF